MMEFPGALGLGAQGKPDFWLGQGACAPVHVAFLAADRKTVDAFYAAALAAGGRDNGKPGLRPQYHPNYYGAFVFDPDGNNIEAVTAPAGVGQSLLGLGAVRDCRRRQHADLEVEIVTADEGALDQSLGRRSPTRPARCSKASPAGPGCGWRERPVDRYAENGGGLLDGVLPVFVDVPLADPPQGEELRLQIDRLTLADREVARARARERAASRPGLGSRSGAFGGKLVADEPRAEAERREIERRPAGDARRRHGDEAAHRAARARDRAPVLVEPTCSWACGRGGCRRARRRGSGSATRDRPRSCRWCRS